MVDISLRIPIQYLHRLCHLLNRFSGDKGIAYLSLLIACWVPISNVIATVGLVHASRLSGSENNGKRKNFLVAVLSNPLILATLLGLVCNSFSIELPKLL